MFKKKKEKKKKEKHGQYPLKSQNKALGKLHAQFDYILGIYSYYEKVVQGVVCDSCHRFAEANLEPIDGE